MGLTQGHFSSGKEGRGVRLPHIDFADQSGMLEMLIV